MMKYHSEHKLASISNDTKQHSSIPVSTKEKGDKVEQDCHSPVFGKAIPSFNNRTHSNTIMPNDITQKPQVEQLTPIYLRHADCIAIPQFALRPYSSILPTHHTPRPVVSKQKKQRPIQPYPTRMSPSSPILNEKKQVKTIRDGLTDDEKRVNHIVSEQKRRNTIRLGFKDLTELVPTLKNINNSKSTILFKAVDYIRYLDKRNKSLHDKLNALQLRIQMENKKNVAGRKEPSPLIPLKPASAGLSHHKFSHLPPDTINALLAHKQQQQQLEELQAQLHSQKRLLSKRLVFSHLQDSNNKNATIYRSISIPTTTNTSST